VRYKHYSRLNRTYKGKKTIVLNFVNPYDNIDKAFSKYYTNTKLTRDINPRDIFKFKQKIDMRNILDVDNMQAFTVITIRKPIPNLKVR
jgi:type I restriction enzyme, R subunit